MTKEEFKKGLLEKYPEGLVQAAFEFADSIGLHPESLVGEARESAEMTENVAAISFIQGFGFCADNVAPYLNKEEKQ